MDENEVEPELTEVKIHFEGSLPKKLINELETRHFRLKLKETPKDLCKVCDYDLYYDESCSKRIAITEESRANGEVFGWICPNCWSEFNLNDDLVKLMMKDIQGLT